MSESIDNRVKHGSEKRDVNRAAVTVGFYTFLSRVLGLLRDIVVAKYFGSGMSADAFFVAFRIPNLLRRLFAEGSLTIAFIPVFTEYLRTRSKEEAFQLARVVLTLLSIILTIVTILGILCSPWIVRVQAWGFGISGEKYELTVLLTRITFPYIFLVSIVALFMGILNSMRHFTSPAAAPIFLNAGIIGATLWLSPYLSQPIVGVAIGVIIGGILQVFLQIPWIIKKGISLFPCWMPDHPAVKRIGLLMLPAIFGSAIYQFNQFAGTLLASLLEEGSVSWLYYADRLVQFPLGVFAIALSTASLPSLAKHATDMNFDDFTETLNHTLRLTFFVTIPSIAGLIILGKPIIQIFFERGAFDPLSTDMTAKALIFYSVGLWAFSGARVVVAAFYAFQDTKTPVRVATITMVINFLLSLLLMGTPLKHGGLALALSIASSIQFFLLLIFLKRRLLQWDLRSVSISAGKAIASSMIMGAVVYFLNVLFLSDSQKENVGQMVIKLIFIILAGVIIYFISAVIMKSREVKHFKGILFDYRVKR
ncbi:MAG: murein biosynthesis integral membrane protein MurJ [Deltaproteobacteria bacterium]|nr:murein biosynthesis integral membrane protein MurJ [Deltaproteobacteria bacterium]